VSCTRSYDITKLHTHCGCCSQCLDRRFAILAADANQHDPVEMYKVELLTGARSRANDKTMAESYVRTALELHEMGELAFFGKFSGETARVCSGFASQKPDEVARQVLVLHQRHGQAIWDVLKTAVEGHSTELVRRSLPPSCVLMMTVAPSGTPALAPGELRSDPVERWIEQAEAEQASDPQRGSVDFSDQAPVQTHEASRLDKAKPVLELARVAIKEVYPNGVPDQTTERNTILCRKIGDWLKNNRKADISNATILRAAGRRK
jgi:hypothetical protein